MSVNIGIFCRNTKIFTFAVNPSTMKLLLFLLLPLSISAQPLSGSPCANKAILFSDRDISDMTMDQVEEAMCDCRPFAKNNDLLVYLDDSLMHVATTFAFRDRKCISMSLRVSCSNATEDALAFAEYIDRSCSHYDRADKAFMSREKAHVSTQAWLSPTSFLQLSTENKKDRDIVQLAKIFMR